MAGGWWPVWWWCRWFTKYYIFPEGAIYRDEMKQKSHEYARRNKLPMLEVGRRVVDETACRASGRGALGVAVVLGGLGVYAALPAPQDGGVLRVGPAVA